MAGLYIHIPYCRKACIYCDFHFSTSLKSKANMVAAICREIKLRRDFFGTQQTLSSVYMGGGTPSVLSQDELMQMFEEIYRHFTLEEGTEITLEANPDDLSLPYLNALRKTPVNRLSIGIQSFDPKVLKWMNRSHSAEQARHSVESARDMGFDNLTADLILGVPHQSQQAWESNLRQFLDWRLPHLSVYSLAVEAQTALAFQLKKGNIELPSDQVYEDQFLQAHKWLEEAGYHHYEISSYALPGFKARHNSSYWDFRPYLGVGPSAHSFDGKSRSWNIANNAIYLRKLEAGQSPVQEVESLDDTDRYHEYLMTHLRKAEGISQQKIQENFIPDWKLRYKKEVDHWLNKGYLIDEGDVLRCSPKGWIMSDQIISDLF